MPRAFAPPAIEVWLPAALPPGLLRQRDARFVSGVARLKSGVTLAQAQSEVRRAAQRLGEQFPQTDKDWTIVLEDYRASRTGSSVGQLSLLYGAVAALLLILCTNVSGLMLGQLQRRGRELAIRSSLGATRAQVASVVLREGAVLVLASVVLSLPFGWYGLALLTRMFATLPRIHEARFDWRIALYTVGAAAIMIVIVSGIPAWQATRGRLTHLLAAGGRGQIGRPRAHRALVAVQFAVTLALLAGAGLLLRSYDNLTRVDSGVRADQVLTFHVGAEWSEDRTRVGVLQRQLLEEIGRLPGVRAAGFVTFLPAGGATLRRQISIEGRAESGDDGRMTVGARSIGGSYLRAIGVPLLEGEHCPADRHHRRPEHPAPAPLESPRQPYARRPDRRGSDRAAHHVGSHRLSH